MAKYQDLIQDLGSIHSPDGSVIDITETDVGKKFLNFYNNDREEFLEHLYAAGYEKIDSSNKYLDFGLEGNSIIRIKLSIEDGEVS